MIQTQNRNDHEDEDADEDEDEDEDGSDFNLLRVDGPVAYSCWLYRNQANQPTLIHNFGDVHVHRSGCSTMKNDEDPFMSIEELIWETMHTAIGFDVIDFFLEVARHDCYSNINKQPLSELLNQGAINRLENTFASCLCLADMQTCQRFFPAGRIHASDIRSVLGFAGGPVVEDWPEIEDKQSDTWKGFKYIVTNQIYHVEDEIIRNELFKMYDEIKALSRKDLQKNSYAPLMDIYLLGRLFRSYKPYPDQKPKSAFDNAPVQNAVIYSGEHHKRIYDQFFRKIGTKKLYGFNSPIISENIGLAQCVKIPTFVNDRHRLYLPMVSDFETNPDIIELAYNNFENLEQPPLYMNYAITKDKKEVKLLRPQQTLFEGQKFPQPKYPKKPRLKEPQAKRQRREQ